uniref:RdRp n=1 Tax=Hubei partiti-like virus 12 TaxID=1923018 RepID=A0A1L3KLI8_9VIRU|nr:RdRp [Hubei partiti-like virus 12]
MNIKPLPKGVGFSANFTRAPVDKTALASFVKVKGKDAALKILKTWHRPKPSLELVRESLLDFGNSTRPRINHGEYFAILKQTLSEFAPSKKIIPLTLGAAYLHPDFPRRKSPGLPWIQSVGQRGRDFLDKQSVWTDPSAQQKIRWTWDMIGHGRNITLPDCAAYNRVIASKQEKTKIRPVWGYPVDVILEEARFFYPLLEYIKCTTKKDHSYGLGLENACGGQSYLMDMFMKTHHDYTTAFVGDWSRFDSSIPAWLIRDVFNYMSDWFDFGHVLDSEGKIWPVNPDQSINRYNKLVQYFINTPIRLPNGERFRKNHGIPSGSMFTNIMDTFINGIVTRYLTYHCTGRLPYGDVYYGDDSVIIVQKPFNVENFSKLAFDTFGMTVNVDKSYVTDEITNLHWLGFYCNYGTPIRNNEFLYASYIFPEHRVNNTLETATRCLGQLYSTLDPVQAVVWYKMLLEVIEYGKLQMDELVSYIRSDYRKSFKYLENLGWKPDDITVPTLSVGLFEHIPSVTPLPCKRKFTKRIWDLQHILDRFPPEEDLPSEEQLEAPD